MLRLLQLAPPARAARASQSIRQAAGGRFFFNVKTLEAEARQLQAACKLKAQMDAVLGGLSRAVHSSLATL